MTIQGMALISKWAPVERATLQHTPRSASEFVITFFFKGGLSWYLPNRKLPTPDPSKDNSEDIQGSLQQIILTGVCFRTSWISSRTPASLRRSGSLQLHMSLFSMCYFYSSILWLHVTFCGYCI